MAENNNNLKNTVSEAISNGSLDDKPLIRSFLKYLTDTPANTLLAIDFAKSLFRYSVPDLETIDDPATLLNATRYVAEFAINGGAKNASDEMFVRFLLNKIDKDPDLITFDMIADLVESDAYKKFGSNSLQDKQNKEKFERWIYDHSLLSKIDQCTEVDVVLYQDGMTRVINAVAPSKKNQNAKYLNQIDAKVKEFDETYLKNVNDEEVLEALKKNAKNTANQDYVAQLKNVYAILGKNSYGDFLADVIDGASSKGAADSKVRNSMLLGFGMAANKVLLAASMRRKWAEKDFNDAYLKFPIELRAEKFKEQEQVIAKMTARQRGKVQSNQTANAQTAQRAETFETIETPETTNETEQVTNEAQQATNNQPKFNLVFDVIKTFGGTLTGAAAISTITSIPGVGQIVGPALGVTMVATAGISSAIANYKAARKHGEVSKTEAKKIAIQSGIAMLGKAWPYAAAMALGPAGRVLGSGVVFAKTLYADLERRAGLQQEKAKGIFGKLKRFAEMGRSVSLSEGLKSLAYAAGKGAAVFLGGAMGSEIGSSIGSNISFDNSNGKLSVTANTQKVADDLEETKFTGKLLGVFKGLHGQEQAPIENLQPAGADYDMSQVQEPLQQPLQQPFQEPSGNIQLSENNLERLGKIGEVELTEHARMTAHADNHRQFVGGVQQDWYNSAQEETAMQTLRAAGVEDPAGVLRKAGSMARFFGGKYQTTLDNLCAGNCTDQDVDNIFDALKQINEEGGLGQIIKQPVYQDEPVYEPVTETTEVPAHTQEYRVPNDELVVDNAPDPLFVPNDNVIEPVDPIDVPPHTQDYRTPNDTVVAESIPMPEMHYEPVDIDNSIDYIEDDYELTNLDVPDHTEDYRTPNENIVSEPEPTGSIPIPSHTADYTAPDVFGNEYQDVTYDNGGMENEPAPLSDDQMARIRASWIRSGELPQEGMDNYLSSLNSNELNSTLNYLSNEELSTISKNLPDHQVNEPIPTNLPNTDLDPQIFDSQYRDNLVEVRKAEMNNHFDSLKGRPGVDVERLEATRAELNDKYTAMQSTSRQPETKVNIDNYEMSGNYADGYNYTSSNMTDRSDVLSAIRDHNQSLER